MFEILNTYLNTSVTENFFSMPTQKKVKIVRKWQKALINLWCAKEKDKSKKIVFQ